jgi:hypothetical protein
MNSPLQSGIGVEGNDRTWRIPDRGEYVRKHTYVYAQRRAIARRGYAARLSV